jgi:hypothetical protein
VVVIQENELVMLMLGAGVFAFTLAHRRMLNRIQAVGLLLAGFYVLLAGWILTVLEGFFLNEVLNSMEHSCYAVSTVLLAAWCWKVFCRGLGSG